MLDGDNLRRGLNANPGMPDSMFLKPTSRSTRWRGLSGYPERQNEYPGYKKARTRRAS
ncbi:MAG: hypothetical protein ACOH2T_21950 [Pseudomonas sp.]